MLLPGDSIIIGHDDKWPDRLWAFPITEHGKSMAQHFLNEPAMKGHRTLQLISVGDVTTEIKEIRPAPYLDI